MREKELLDGSHVDRLKNALRKGTANISSTYKTGRIAVETNVGAAVTVINTTVLSRKGSKELASNYKMKSGLGIISEDGSGSIGANLDDDDSMDRSKNSNKSNMSFSLTNPKKLVKKNTFWQGMIDLDPAAKSAKQLLTEKLLKLDKLQANYLDFIEE